MGNEQPPLTPTRMANTSTVGTDGLERGDLIVFYNSVFIPRLQEFAKKFQKQTSLPPLSPLPVLRANPASPCRKVSENHSLYIRALKPNATNIQYTSPMKPLSYSFSSSPARDLDAINEMVRKEGSRKAGKRLLVDEPDDDDNECGVLPADVVGSGLPRKLLITEGSAVPTRGSDKMIEFLIGGERSSIVKIL